MADRDLWDKAECASRTLAAVLIPVILAVGGYVANGLLERKRDAVETQKLDQEMLNRAIVRSCFLRKRRSICLAMNCP